MGIYALEQTLVIRFVVSKWNGVDKRYNIYTNKDTHDWWHERAEQ